MREKMKVLKQVSTRCMSKVEKALKSQKNELKQKSHEELSTDGPSSLGNNLYWHATMNARVDGVNLAPMGEGSLAASLAGNHGPLKIALTQDVLEKVSSNAYLLSTLRALGKTRSKDSGETKV